MRDYTVKPPTSVSTTRSAGTSNIYRHNGEFFVRPRRFSAANAASGDAGRSWLARSSTRRPSHGLSSNSRTDLAGTTRRFGLSSSVGPTTRRSSPAASRRGLEYSPHGADLEPPARASPPVTPHRAELQTPRPSTATGPLGFGRSTRRASRMRASDDARSQAGAISAWFARGAEIPPTGFEPVSPA